MSDWQARIAAQLAERCAKNRPKVDVILCGCGAKSERWIDANGTERCTRCEINRLAGEERLPPGVEVA